MAPPKKKLKPQPARKSPVERRPWSNHPAWVILSWVACLLPLVALCHLETSFGIEWMNHTWLSGYFGEYMRTHWSLPVMVNGDRVVGTPQPIFYGFLLYPVIGLPASVLGANIAIRLVCAAVFIFQGRELMKAGEAITGNRFLAFCITTLVSFGTYPLTNLYNRAAITEFVAVCLLVSVACMWTRLVFGAAKENRRTLAVKMGIAFGLAAGSHPITAVLGTAVLLVLAALTAFVVEDRRQLSRSIAPGVLVAFVLLAPWIYVAVRYAKDTEIAKPYRLMLLSESIDSPKMRFWPLPRDMRTDDTPFEKISTPYLDGQMNVALLVFTGILAFEALRRSRSRQWRSWKMLAAAGCTFAAFVFFTVASISEATLPLAVKIFYYIQFAYRLITYCDLFLLLTSLLLLASLGRKLVNVRWPLAVCLSACIALSTAGLFVKFEHVAAAETQGIVPGSEYRSDRNALLKVPATFYWTIDYSITKGMTPEPAVTSVPKQFVGFPVGTNEHFGDVLKSTVQLTAETMLTTNAVLFPWSRIAVNGSDVPATQALATRVTTFAVMAGPGNAVVEHRVSPDLIWLNLRRISLLSLFLCILWAIRSAVWSPRIHAEAVRVPALQKTTID
jgi:hypothetical protein